MFGYIRPNKPELLIRQWTHYRSVYCGLCKQIGRDYGQLPRLSLTYDLTFLALLMIALADIQPRISQAGCILNPVGRKPMMDTNPILEYCAAVSVMLAWNKGLDDRDDGHRIRGTAGVWALQTAARKAGCSYPGVRDRIRQMIERLHRLEQGPPNLEAADCFGKLLETVFEQASQIVFAAPRENSADPYSTQKQAMARLGFDLGRWIYLMDAIDDLESDKDNGNWNPFLLLREDHVRQEASDRIAAIEQQLDRTAALLDYRRDAALIANIMQQGLPTVREQILSKEKLKRL